MIYLDNAATTFPKPKTVADEVCKCISEYCGNPGRSSHTLSTKTAEKVYDTREKICEFLNFDRPENIVFTQNATMALNIAIKTAIIPGSHVLISDIEHNSVYRPIYKLAKQGKIEYDIFSSSDKLEENIKKLLKTNTKFIVSTLSSNVTGQKIPLKELSRLAKKYGLFLIIDASQLSGHTSINLAEHPCDILCTAGHKGLFGIQGSAFILFRKWLSGETFADGGSGIDSFDPEMPDYLPERYEAGTLSTPAIISLSAGIDFINNVGICAVEDKIKYLQSKYADILSSNKDIILYEYDNGVISFNFKCLSPELVSEELNRCGICTRAGFHCAPMAHKSLGTEKSGTVRISLSYFNAANECDLFYKALKYINSKYK